MTQRKILWLTAVVLLVLQLALQGRAAALAAQNPALGVTWAQPLTAEGLAAARAWEQSDANAAGLTASFWSKEKCAVSSDFGRTTQDVACVGFSGNAGDCRPAVYKTGTAPGAVGQQCAVSSALAWALFGSEDIVGQTVTLGRTEYVVCGVYDGADAELLYPARAGFTHAALRGTSPDTPKADAEQWAAAAGVGALTAIDYGPQRLWLARALCRLPAALAGVCLVIALLRFAHGLPGLWRGIVYFALALGFALLLPRFLATLPGWLLPARWSNFTFWGELWGKIAAHAKTGL